MSKQRNFYEILNSTPNSTFVELKSNYKQLILQCHPDKVKEKHTTGFEAAASVDPYAAIDNSEFIIINEAWNTLKDPVKRKHYDAEILLTKFQTHSNVFEHLTLDDMTRELEEKEEEMFDKRTENAYKEDLTSLSSVLYFYTYNCRCGGQYIIDESAAAENGIYDKLMKKNNKMLVNNQSEQQSKTQNDCHNNISDKVKIADAEVIVECSECSLVIILSNAKQKSTR